MMPCPVCGVSVKEENLERHLKNRHPREDVDVESVLSKDEARRVRAERDAAKPAVTARGIKIVSVVIIVLAVVLAVVIANPFRGVGPGVGQFAPEFELPTSVGGTIGVTDYRGSVLFLEFMDIDCSHCIAEAQQVLPFLYENYSTRARFLSVSVNFVGAEDTPVRINDFRNTYGTPWVYALDDGRARSAYGVDSTPTTFILDRNGIVSAVFFGENPLASYAAALDRAAQG